MASTQTWSEYNGASAATETTNRAEANWKAIDDSITSYTASVIVAGTNSFSKYQAIKFGGAWNSLSSLTYKVSTAAPATGLSVVASVVTAGVTPTATSTGDSAASTTGTSANFVSSTTPYGTGTTSTAASGTMYANPYRTQLQTTVAAAVGDMATPVTITATWTES
jgi:hypothetical protein